MAKSGFLILALVLQGFAHAEPELDGEEWFKKIQEISKRTSSVDQFLSALPTSLKARHVLMFKSRSLQDADFMRPRVFLISPKAQFILTFNGEPDQAGFEGVETMRFTRAHGRPEFIFEELVFRNDLAKRRDYLAQKNQAKALRELEDREHRTGPNASTCLGCHRSPDPRPNWDHYPFWPGAYGQDDDKISSIGILGIQDPTTGNAGFLKTENERQHLLEFFNSIDEKSRYRHIVDLREVQLENRFEHKPLKKFTHDLAQLNFERIAFQLSRASRRERVLTLLAVIDNCKPSGWGKALGLAPPGPAVVNRTVQFGHKHYLNMEYLFQGSDLPWQNFFMNLIPGPGNNLTIPDHPAPHLTAYIIKHDSELRPMFSGEISGNGYGFGGGAHPGPDACEKLEALLNKN